MDKILQEVLAVKIKAYDEGYKDGHIGGWNLALKCMIKRIKDAQQDASLSLGSDYSLLLKLERRAERLKKLGREPKQQKDDKECEVFSKQFSPFSGNQPTKWPKGE